MIWSSYRVSKGVRELPGNLQSATSNVPSGKALMYFGLFLATGVFFIFIAFTMFLPVMVLMPQKFAICFTLGCCFIIGSFFALKGPKNQLAHMFSKEVSSLNVSFITFLVPPSWYFRWFYSIVCSPFSQCRDFLLRWSLSVVCWAPYTFPWGSTVIFSQFSSLYYRYLNTIPHLSSLLYKILFQYCSILLLQTSLFMIVLSAHIILHDVPVLVPFQWIFWCFLS